MTLGRLLRTEEFRRLLDSPVRQRSAHFALHHLRAGVPAATQAAADALGAQLSTDRPSTCPPPVDESPVGCRLGCVVPKRHARRAVTRSMLKRQMRAAAERLEARLPPGQCLLRLRAPFPVQQFPSADSAALRAQARRELDQLLARWVG